MKQVASLSLDLDNQWSYQKTHGDNGWEDYPSYFDTVVPRVLEILGSRDLKITFFIVGIDATFTKNHQVILSISEAGHEIGNHSYSHEPWMHRYSQPEIEAEIAKAEESLEAVIGDRPIGFRGPGFSCSGEILQILQQRGYLYDASLFPTFIGPLARAYYFMTSSLKESEMEQRKDLFGGIGDVFRPIKQFCWRFDGGGLVEVPVTTMPLFRIPIHVSYLIYIAQYSKPLADLYFKTAITLCQVLNVSPSLLLHPLDFLGGDDIRELSFFPGMGLKAKAKVDLVTKWIEMYSSSFSVVTIKQHVNTLMSKSQTLPNKTVRLSQEIGSLLSK